jgi:hypothetical protein
VKVCRGRREHLIVRGSRSDYAEARDRGDSIKP